MEYTVHYHPPIYPAKCMPGTCRHSPEFVVVAWAGIGKEGCKSVVEYDHAVCLACGLPVACTHGGNVLVDLQMLMQSEIGAVAAIGARILTIRNKWARIAQHLFDEKGWKGRHEAVARKIDPNLTMKLRVEGERDGFLLARVAFDETYLRAA